MECIDRIHHLLIHLKKASRLVKRENKNILQKLRTLLC